MMLVAIFCVFTGWFASLMALATWVMWRCLPPVVGILVLALGAQVVANFILLAVAGTKL